MGELPGWRRVVCTLGRAEHSELIAEPGRGSRAFEPKDRLPIGGAEWSPRFGVGRLAGFGSFWWHDAIVDAL